MAQDRSQQPDNKDYSGGTPLAGSGSPMSNNDSDASQMPPQSSGQSATIQSTPSNQGGSQSQIKAPKPTTKPRSGMFSNIQQYVQKNQPQGQKMAQAVGEKSQKNIQDLSQSIEAKKKAQTNELQNVTNQFTQQKDMASNILENVNNPNQISNEQIDQFRDIYSQGFNIEDPAKVDFSQERRRLQELQNMQDLNTEAGRRQSLQETFRPQGEYGSGAAALDSILLSQAPDTLSSLRDQINAQREQALGGIDTFSKEFTGDLNELQQARIDALNALRSGVDTGISGIQEDLSQRVLDEKAARERALGEISALEQDRNDRLRFLKSVYNPEATEARYYADLYRGLASGAESSYRPFDRYASMYGYRDDFVNKDDFFNKARLTASDIDLLGIDPNLLSAPLLSGVDSTGQVSNYNVHTIPQVRRIVDALKDIEDFSIEQDLVAEGFSPEEISQMGDITEANVADQAEIDRLNLLSRLKGGEDLIVPESKGDYLSTSMLENILAKYRQGKPIRSSGTVKRPKLV